MRFDLHHTFRQLYESEAESTTLLGDNVAEEIKSISQYSNLSNQLADRFTVKHTARFLGLNPRPPDDKHHSSSSRIHPWGLFQSLSATAEGSEEEGVTISATEETETGTSCEN